MRRSRRIANVVLAALLVLTMMMGPVVSPVAAADDEIDECENETESTLTALSKLVTGQRTCIPHAQEFQNATAADLYASGLALEDLKKSSLTGINNTLEISKTYVRTLIKSEAVKAFNNGTNKSRIKEIVNASIEAYYAQLQYNLLQAHESAVTQAYYIRQARIQEGLDERRLVMAWNDTSEPQAPTTVEDAWSKDFWPADNSSGYNITWTLVKQPVELADGREINVTMILRENNGYDFYTDPSGQWHPEGLSYKYRKSAYYGISPEAYDYWQTHGDGTVGENDYNASNSAELYDEGEFAKVWRRIDKQSRQMKDKAAKYVDGLFATYNQSEGIDITEVIDANTLATQWNTNYNETGYWGWIAAEFGLSGMEGSINHSFTISYTPRENHSIVGKGRLNTSPANYSYRYYAGETYNVTGTLFTDWAPNKTNGSFVAGTTYDTANATAPVLFVAQVGPNTTRVIRLNGTFTVSDLRNVRTGESINSTDLERHNIQTWNESSTKEELQQLLEYRNITINTYDTGGGGGGAWFDFDGVGISLGGFGAMLLIGAGIVVFLLGSRD